MNVAISSHCVPVIHTAAPLICFSHLRWDFVKQRPQHLMERFAATRQVFFFEEHIPTDHHLPYFELHAFDGTSVIAVRPRVPHWFDAKATKTALCGLLRQLIAVHRAPRPLLWFYTPMMWPLAEGMETSAIVYDCMDELANFRFASETLRDNEAALMRAADVVFTGGYSMYEARAQAHDNIHAMPSSVDVAHFRAARGELPCPEDMRGLSRPILGYYGVIDERIDLPLIAYLAAARPDWSIVMLGPVVKIRGEDLPKAPNIHYLGQKPYDSLPEYLAHWDVAIMPFALNCATRYISPTKTPEYLAGGRHVVSTAISDVRRGYGDCAAVRIADDAAGFVAACDAIMEHGKADKAIWAGVDRLLAHNSWDMTFSRMNDMVGQARETRDIAGIAQSVFRPGIIHKRKAPYDVLVVGAGFAGSVIAERCAAMSGKRVLVCDRRPHIGGNAYDFSNEAGLLIHRYGPHIFHTNSAEIFSYLSRFTEWRPYEHRVLASVEAGLVPMPINRATLSRVFDMDLADDAAAAAFMTAQAEHVPVIRNARDVVVGQVGSRLYEMFFRGYTRKQWGRDPSELDASVTARVPARASLDDRYFTDKYQAMPKRGYTRLFENMLDHDGIDIELSTDHRDLDPGLAPLTIFTGPIDTFFDRRFGALPYRSLTFRHETLNQEIFQPVGVVNYPSEDVPYTRITEYKYLTGQTAPRTAISYEYASAEGEPYYPVPHVDNRALYRRYEALAAERGDVMFLGRLGTYQYYNMDQVVGQALAAYRRLDASGRLSVAGAAERDAG